MNVAVNDRLVLCSKRQPLMFCTAAAASIRSPDSTFVAVTSLFVTVTFTVTVPVIPTLSARPGLVGVSDRRSTGALDDAVSRCHTSARGTVSGTWPALRTS
jgi:hypothetical protein